jgi:hypothetical protein
MAIVACSGCRRPADQLPPDVAATGDLAVRLTLKPTAPLVKEDTLAELTMADGAGQPVLGAKVRIEAHMSHPGMAPVIAAATEKAAGVYSARLRLSMAGDWIFVVRGERTGGRSINQRAGETTARERGAGAAGSEAQPR